MRSLCVCLYPWRSWSGSKESGCSAGEGMDVSRTCSAFVPRNGCKVERIVATHWLSLAKAGCNDGRYAQKCASEAIQWPGGTFATLSPVAKVQLGVKGWPLFFLLIDGVKDSSRGIAAILFAIGRTAIN